MKNIKITACPVCRHELNISRLTCRSCGLEITKDFSFSIFDSLKDEQLDFLKNFILANGSFKRIQEMTGMPYHQVRKSLEQIKQQLSLTSASNSLGPDDIVIKELPIYQNDAPIIKRLKEKINNEGGLAQIPLPRGKSFQIYYEEYGTGIHATNIPSNKVLLWKAFEDSISLLEKNNGRVIKGNAMKGKLGDSFLPINSMEGYIASHTYHVKKGETTLRLISAIAAVLEWSGFCKNGYGYVEMLHSAPYNPLNIHQ